MQVDLLRITDKAETLIEFAGRVSHQSEPNGDPGAFIKKLIGWGHESVLEHAYATFKFSGISRACTHQLVRHRLVSFTQKSQRYCKEGQFEFVTPPQLKESKSYPEVMAKLQEYYNSCLMAGFDAEDARFVLPNACTTEIVVSANFRQWRHMIRLRTSKHAQWEIRNVFLEVLKILVGEAPSCFSDLIQDSGCSTSATTTYREGNLGLEPLIPQKKVLEQPEENDPGCGLNIGQVEFFIDVAKRASERSGAWKSKYKVGCAIVIDATLTEGHVVTGCNVEFHGADPLHAEISAIGELYRMGFKPDQAVAVCVYCPDRPWDPCGNCRQALFSTFREDLPVIAAGPDKWTVKRLKDLLPGGYKRVERKEET